jgi:hypothetical protein
MFRSRLELIAYVIHSITDAPQDECNQMALQYEAKPFIVKITCD